MSESTEWQNEKFNEVFEEELRGLERRRKHDSSCTRHDLEGILKNLYISDGNNWEGRGAMGDTVMAATIAAYEHFIEEWKNETA